jgi:hypothetical protein
MGSGGAQKEKVFGSAKILFFGGFRRPVASVVGEGI